MAKQDDYVRYTIRVPKEVFDPLEKAAEAANRSANAEIIARLEFSVEHPKEEFERLVRKLDSLQNEIVLMEMDLKDQATTIEGLKGEKAELKRLLTHLRDLQERLMYHVLNYIDEIPAELAIWAFDMAQTVGRPREELEGVASEAEARKIIVARRDAFRKRALESMREFLASRDDDGAEKA